MESRRTGGREKNRRRQLGFQGVTGGLEKAGFVSSYLPLQKSFSKKGGKGGTAKTNQGEKKTPRWLGMGGSNTVNGRKAEGWGVEQKIQTRPDPAWGIPHAGQQGNAKPWHDHIFVICAVGGGEHGG